MLVITFFSYFIQKVYPLIRYPIPQSMQECFDIPTGFAIDRLEFFCLPQGLIGNSSSSSSSSSSSRSSISNNDNNDNSGSSKCGICTSMNRTVVFLNPPQIRCVAAGTLFPVQYLYLFLNQFRTKSRFTFHSYYFMFCLFFYIFRDCDLASIIFLCLI